MSLEKRRRRLDWPMTVMGYGILVVGLWFLWSGFGLLLDWLFPPPPDTTVSMPIIDETRPIGALLYLGLGACCVGLWWWLSGEFIRRWWWKRTGQDGRVHDTKTS